MVISKALHDFNTPVVLGAVRDLLSKGMSYVIEALRAIDEKELPPLEPVYAMRHYLTHLLHTFGLRFIQPYLADTPSSPSKEEEGYTSALSLAKKKEKLSAVHLLDSLVQFRSQVRGTAVGMRKRTQQNGAEPIDVESMQADAKRLLECCDIIRKTLAEEHGIVIEDLPGDVSKWTQK